MILAVSFIGLAVYSLLKSVCCCSTDVHPDASALILMVVYTLWCSSTTGRYLLGSTPDSMPEKARNQPIEQMRTNYNVQNTPEQAFQM